MDVVRGYYIRIANYMEKELSRLTQLQEETVKLLVLLVKKDEVQQSMILKLSASGFKTTRIAELLGTTSNTVNVTIQKAKKKRI